MKALKQNINNTKYASHQAQRVW